MDRTACVDLPALPLQVLYGRHPDFSRAPAAVVDEDRPQGIVLAINDQARRGGVITGMRYAAARSLAPTLRAGAVSREEVDATVAAAAARMLRFTPRVEPFAEEPGVFFLDASGLARLHPSLARWADAIRRDLAAIGLTARAAVGFSRFGVYAAAKTTRELAVFDDPAEEARVARRVPLDRLGIAPTVRDALERLGVTTVGAFLALPENGVLRRFGEEALRLHRLASGAASPALRPLSVEPPPAARVDLVFGERDAARLLFLLKERLDPLLVMLAERREALAELSIRLALEDGTVREERLRTAAPTLDAAQVLDLAHLRLASLRLAAGVVEMTLTAAGVAVVSEQLALFAEKPRRDAAAAARAFARIVAEFGEDAVVLARLVDAHPPERQFAWEPMDRLAAPRPRLAGDRPLVRRILATPRALPRRPRHEPDGPLLFGLERGPVVRLSGPYPLSTLWWTDAEVRRDYHFAETAKGDLLWAFEDAVANAWFLQGRVE